MKVYQQILRGERSSNRGFRYRRLTPTECDALELKAAKLLTMKGDIDLATAPGLLRQITINEGIRAMLVAVTKAAVPVPPDPPLPAKLEDGTQPPAPEPEEPLLDDPSLWLDVDLGMLMTPGPNHYDSLFTATDHTRLKWVFRFNHEAIAESVDSVVKKERTVSTG
jgi:hypothetical protein